MKPQPPTPNLKNVELPQKLDRVALFRWVINVNRTPAPIRGKAERFGCFVFPWTLSSPIAHWYPGELTALSLFYKTSNHFDPSHYPCLWNCRRGSLQTCRFRPISLQPNAAAAVLISGNSCCRVWLTSSSETAEVRASPPKKKSMAMFVWVQVNSGIEATEKTNG